MLAVLIPLFFTSNNSVYNKEQSPALDKPAAVNSPKHSAFCSGSPYKQVRSRSSLSHPNSGCRYLKPHLTPGNHHFHREHRCTGQWVSPARARLQDLPRGWEQVGTCRRSHLLLKAFLQLSFPTVNSWCRETIKKKQSCHLSSRLERKKEAATAVPVLNA